jgi:hypothetical protein
MYLNVGPCLEMLALSRRYGSLVKGTLLKVPDHCYFDIFHAQGGRGPTIKCLSCPVSGAPVSPLSSRTTLAFIK